MCMNVLLVGEFSSLHKYLKEGLLKNGASNVTLLANGDGWKSIKGADDLLYCNNGSVINKGLSGLYIINNLDQYDVIQFIHPRVYPTLFNLMLVKRLCKKGRTISLASAGNDFAIMEAYRNHRFDYYIFDQEPQMLEAYSKTTFSGRTHIKSDLWLADRADVIIPSLYEYSAGYEGRQNLNEVIPFPINIDEIKYTENDPHEKLVFFHGLTRESIKGTKFIRAALERLKDNYPNDVEIVIDGHMPFDKYIEVMNKTNVVIDQCCGYGYGISSCLAMAQGKVVMTSYHTKTKEAMHAVNTPIFELKPDVDQIYSKLIDVMDSKNRFLELSVQSRQFVETYHDYSKVAKQYCKAWGCEQ